MCDYEQIADEKKDLGSIVDAKENFKYVVENYPDTDYDTKLSVDYSRLTVVLVNAIKEQQEQIEDMKERLEYLESNV